MSAPDNGTGGTDRARGAFLEALRRSCNVSAACREAGIPRRTAYNWKRDDPSFAAEWADAEGEAIDMLEGVAYARAIAGESDRMLEVLLKGHRPERYVERKHVEHSGGVTYTKIEREFVSAPHPNG